MDEKITSALKRIALLGGMRDGITLSSREQGMVREMLGKAIGYDVHKGIRAELVGVTGNGVEIG